MAWDIAIDYNTGDLKLSPSGEFDVRTGRTLVEQRIRVRLRIENYADEDNIGWPLDPTGGRLGSRLHELWRIPRQRAEEEVELVVREALEDMEDISIVDVAVLAPTLEIPSNVMTIRIDYAIIEDDEDIIDEEDISTIELGAPVE